jgi:hypothetical protein
LGQYGGGRVIKTFTLLPGEKAKISTRTYTRTEIEAKRASSILDSVSEESTKDYENSIATEQSDKKNYQESFSYEINAKAHASWGWGNADVSGGVKGGTNSAHEEFSKNTSNAIQKHASRASSKREVQVNTSYEEKEVNEVETSIEREVQNINVSRTLNFVFRQMNQQYITALILFDARIAVWDGNPDPSTSIRMEVSLPDLRSLLRRFIVPDLQQTVEDAIIDQLTTIFDYEGKEINDFIVDETLLDRNGNPAKDQTGAVRLYWRVNPKKEATYGPDPDGNTFAAKGILVLADVHVMRTDGIIVEALIGEGDALDSYSHGLQNEAIRTKSLENDKKELAIDIVKNRKKSEAGLFEKVFPCCQPEIFSLWPPKDSIKKSNNTIATEGQT